MSVLCVDVGGSGATVTRATGAGHHQSAQVALPVARPAPHRVELDPGGWFDALGTAPPDWDPGPVDAVVVTTLRQGFVLTDGRRELGNGVLNSDRRGASHLHRLDDVPGLYALTGHWPAPELTLPKLLQVAATEPDRWAATTRVLFVHDWLVWRLTGVEATEASYACGGGMADVRARDWATDLLDDLGLGRGRWAPVVEAGSEVGRLRAPFWGARVGTPVVAGCADTQMAALGACALREGVVTVVAGSSTPVQAATAEPVVDPLEHPWVSTHAAPGLWAAETNCGYPGTMQGWWAGMSPAAPSGVPGAGGLVAVTGSPEWSRRGWTTKSPMTLLGLRPDTGAADVAQALAEAHAFSIRANVEDLERVLGASATEIVVTGGVPRRDEGFTVRLSEVLGRAVEVRGGAAADAALALVTGRSGGSGDRVEADDDERRSGYDAAYRRYVEVWQGLRERLPEEET